MFAPRLPWFRSGSRQDEVLSLSTVLRLKSMGPSTVPIVGSYVRLSRARGCGTVRYVGELDPEHGKPGLWYGIELEEPNGLHNGNPFAATDNTRALSV